MLSASLSCRLWNFRALYLNCMGWASAFSKPWCVGLAMVGVLWLCPPMSGMSVYVHIHIWYNSGYAAVGAFAWILEESREEKNRKLLSKADFQQDISQPSPPSPWCVFSDQHHHSAPLWGGTLQQINISQTCLVRVLINFCLEQLYHSSLCSCRDSLLRLSQVWRQKRKAALCKQRGWAEQSKLAIWTQNFSLP